MANFTAADGTNIFFKDWGQGRPLVFSHGWPLSADAWDAQMLFLVGQGFRVVAHDRRGHGRSDQPAAGNDIDTWADDLAALMDHLDLRDAIMVGHSTGGGEVARVIGRHGTGRVAKLVFTSAIVPLLARTDANPEGAPKEALDGLRAGLAADRAQLYRDVADGPFFGANRQGAHVSQGVRDDFWRMSMQGGVLAHLATADSWEVDYTPDLQRIDRPTLIVHGEDDQIVPIAAAALKSSRIVAGAELKVYEGAPHGLPATHADRYNADLLAFARG